MPCFTIRKTTVELKVANETLLEKAFAALGLTHIKRGNTIELRRNGVRIASYTGGQLTLEYGQSEDLVNEVKQAYAKEGLKLIAKKYGKTLVRDDRNKNKFTITMNQGRR